MERTVLHVDCNKFYASVECLHRPEIRNRPVAVGGSAEDRHGIILTKNEIASKYGIKTAEPIWQAKQKCPELVVVSPNFPLYVRFSNMARKIYKEYSEFIEPFGLDENWIDVTGCRKSGEEIANEIRCRIKFELGITVSVGVSWNKIFAKFGSDYKKPDAVTVINKANYKNIVWNSPCSDLIFVGRSTAKKLNSYGIYTVGDIANSDCSFLRSVFGKNGEMLYRNANGLNTSPVARVDDEQAAKSVGNSITTPRDMVNNADVKAVLMMLCESVAQRLRKQGVKGKTVSIYVRDKDLKSFTRQGQLDSCSDVSSEILDEAMLLFLQNYDWVKPVRSIGVSVSDFGNDFLQFDLSGNARRHEKLERVEHTVDDIRRRFGDSAVLRATLLCSDDLKSAKKDPLQQPLGSFKTWKGMC